MELEPHSDNVELTTDNKELKRSSPLELCRNRDYAETAMIGIDDDSNGHKLPIKLDETGVVVVQELIGDPNETEYSSSFDCTIDDDDDENLARVSEGEVESQFFGDNNGFGSAFDDFDRVFPTKKRKLTNHWRNYIRPVMWRCKWMELRMKELDTQVLKYSRELEVFDQEKASELDRFGSEEFCSKSLQFLSRRTRKKAMKRRKRKRVEDTTDIDSYMSQHNFFSYLENKRAEVENTCLAEEVEKTEPTGDRNDKLSNEAWVPFDYKVGDISMEEILSKMETLHSRVKSLKGQMESVMAKFCASTAQPHSPALSTEYDIGEGIVVPDITESSVGLLSAADITLHHPHPQFVDSSEDIVENIVMHEDVATQVEEEEPQEDVKPCLGSDIAANFPRNTYKRKRGERKPGHLLPRGDS